MHRVDAPGNDNNRFSAGDPANGIWPTELDADWHNAVQEAICRVIEGAGLPLEKGNDDQLRDAIAARIAAEMTAAQILAKLLTVDGSGSGLDADLLDGLEGAVFLRRLNEVWNTDADGNPRFYFQKAVNGGRTYLRYKSQLVLTPDDSRYPVAVDEDGNVTIAGIFRRQNNILWDAGNDGSGSGLDADLLRGLTPDQVVSAARVLAALGHVPAIGNGYAANGDLNQITQSGIYRFDQPINGPGAVAWGQLLVMHGAADTIAQIAFGGSGDCYVRSGNPAVVGGIGQWSTWRQVVTDSLIGGGTLAINGATMRRNGTSLWGPDNDGSGSGLDADLWRGLDPAAFFAAYFPSGTTNGWNWRKWPDGQGGMMVRMARITDPFFSQTAYQTWNYPFPLSELTDCGATTELIQNNISADQGAQIYNPTTTQITINMQDMDGNTTWPIKARIFVEGRL